MSELLTRCPHCTTVFRLSLAQLKAARGRVRCGACLNLFHALDDLLERQPEQRETPSSPAVPPLSVRPSPAPPPMPASPGSAPPTGSASPSAPPPPVPAPPSSASPAGASVSSVPPSPAGPQPAAPQVEPALPAVRLDLLEPAQSAPLAPAVAEMPAVRLGVVEALHELPEPATRPLVDVEAVLAISQAARAEPGQPAARRGGRLVRALWGFGACALLLLFALQLVWFQHAELAERAPWLAGPVGKLCALIGCRPAEAVLPGRLSVISRDVRQHPRLRDALLLNATLLNDTAVRLPFPTLQLTLQDSSGALLGRRRFPPSSYLDTSVDLEEGLGPGQSAQVVLEVLDRGERAVSFEIELL